MFDRQDNFEKGVAILTGPGAERLGSAPALV
jgi:hypothetical protein